MSTSLTQFRLEQKFQRRIYFFAALIFISGFMVISQLTNLQLVHGFENSIRAKKFVSRQEFTRAPRGLIYGRNYPEAGVSALFVNNINYIDFIIYPARFKNQAAGLRFIKIYCILLGKSFDQFEKKLTAHAWKNLVRKNKSFVLLHRMTRKEQERLIAFNSVLSKGAFVTNHLRYYAMGPAMAHVNGYIGLPSRREIAQKKALPYQTIGKTGIEAVYDRELKGTDGIRIRYRTVNSEEQIASSEHGKNIVLTIDRKIQTAAYKALLRTKKRGAVIALQPATGEILALVSTHAFDPNILSSGTRRQRAKHIKEINRHESFLNFAIQTRFAPASTFKSLVALAALESAAVDPVTEFTSFSCPGRWVLKSTLPGVPDSQYICWKHSGHGTNNLIDAIAKSCNVYFYQLGYKIGPTKIIRMARQFRLNKKTGIDLPGEIAGFIPDQRWKQLRLSSQWYDGDTINLAIGQGFLEITPLENAMLYAALINRGKIYRPILVREIRNPINDQILRKFYPELIKEIPILPTNLEIIQRGLRAVFTRGTASFLNQKEFQIAGKTGTVQTRNKRKGRNHAWFIGYAPYGAEIEKTIVVAVFVEDGGSGALSAAPIAVETFRAALLRDNTLSNKINKLTNR